MTTLTMRNHRGDTVEVESYSATEAKNAFGQLLDRTIAGGMVAITRHHEPRAVLLSIDEYETLMARVEDPIDRLREDFDGLVARMQSPAAKAAGAELFRASEPDPEPDRAAATQRRR